MLGFSARKILYGTAIGLAGVGLAHNAALADELTSVSSETQACLFDAGAGLENTPYTLDEVTCVLPETITDTHESLSKNSFALIGVLGGLGLAQAIAGNTRRLHQKGRFYRFAPSVKAGRSK